jgi:hypothetical protein
METLVLRCFRDPGRANRKTESAKIGRNISRYSTLPNQKPTAHNVAVSAETILIDRAGSLIHQTKTRFQDIDPITTKKRLSILETAKKSEGSPTREARADIRKQNQPAADRALPGRRTACGRDALQIQGDARIPSLIITTLTNRPSSESHRDRSRTNYR